MTKQIIKAVFALNVLCIACLLLGCGKSEQADPKAETPPAQTQAEGERVQNDQARHFQEIQQHKQAGDAH